MNKNVMIVLVGGFIIAVLVAVLVQASLGGKKKDDTGPKTQVLVAAKDMSIGADIGEGHVKWQTWPGNAFAGAILRKGDEKAADVLKGRLIQKVSAGQPMLDSYVFKDGKGNVVAAGLDKGMRAIAIPVKADTMAGGFVSPGDRVDVILTYKVSAEQNAETPEMYAFVHEQAAETILKNIKVLAVDQEASRDEDKAKIARTVTLAVNQKSAEKLSLAANMGDLTLTLRGIGDEGDLNPTAITTDVEISQTMQNLIKLREERESAKPVRIYNGPSVSETSPRSAQGTGASTGDGRNFREEEGTTVRNPVIIGGGQ